MPNKENYIIMIALIPKTFFIMRHGETTDNALGLISGGASNPYLTLKGHKQAEIAAFVFEKLSPKPTLIVSSDLTRAHTTARIVTGKTDIIRDAGLNERHLGEYDGKITEKDQTAMERLPGEESRESHLIRTTQTLNKYLTAEKSILAVCHGGTIRRILEAASIASKIEIANAHIYKLHHDKSTWLISDAM